jgi:DNA polymerase-3 subunit alpha
VINSFVYVRAFIKEGWVNRETGKKGDPRIQFNSFQLLHDVMETYAKKLSIQLNIDDLKEGTISNLHNLLRTHVGSNTLNFVVYDNKEKLKVQMPSRKQKVKISQELLNELEGQDFRYKLN